MDTYLVLNKMLVNSETEKVANLPILAFVQIRKLFDILINLTLTRVELLVRLVVHSITVISNNYLIQYIYLLLKLKAIKKCDTMFS
jgi:hypothetical protein